MTDQTTVYIATSLDGFIADQEGGLDWLTEGAAEDEGDYGFVDFLASIDAIIMGRRTFETVASFGDWPYDKPVFVASTTLHALPPEHRRNALLVSGHPGDILSTLRAEGHRRFYIDGGNTIRRFLEADLIDRLILTRIPTLLGGGTPLFGPLARPLSWRHAETKILSNRLVQSTYERARSS